MPKVQIRPQAEEDLFQIWHYIAVAHNSPTNAASFVKKLDRQFTALASSPQLGRQKLLISLRYINSHLMNTLFFIV